MEYEIFQPDPATSERFVRRLRDGAIIPIAEGNRDFQEFLEWNSRQEHPLVWE